MVWLKASLRLSLTLHPRTSHKIDDSTALLRQDQTFMKQVNVHKLWEKHFPSNRKSLYKVHLACDHLFPCWPLDQDLGQRSATAPRDTWARRGEAPGPGTRGHWMHPFLTSLCPAPGVDHSIPLGMGQHTREDEVGVCGLANLYLREESHHDIGRRGGSS